VIKISCLPFYARMRFNVRYSANRFRNNGYINDNVQLSRCGRCGAMPSITVTRCLPSSESCAVSIV
jgi:hypothetical protein